jgi:dienelactone hydrolase
MPQRAEHESKISPYGLGHTALFASQYDQRFSYCLYVPKSFREEGENTYPLAVIMHGSRRDAQAYRDRFADWAEEAQVVLLAPLFPGGIIVPGDVSNYRFMEWHGIRFDQVLLAMIDEVTPVYRLRSERFLLHGFSAGGHFAHRFFYLHPQRLAGVSIGAPGIVTLLDQEHDFWVGVRDLEARFGIAPNIPAMREVPVQMVVGGDDTETWEISIPPDHPRWMPGAELAGPHRLARMTALRDSFERNGISVQLDVVPGVAHSHVGVVDAVEAFFQQMRPRLGE